MSERVWQFSKHSAETYESLSIWADGFKLSDVNPREWRAGSMSLNKQMNKIAKAAFDETLQGLQFAKFKDSYHSTRWFVLSVNVHEPTSEIYILLQHVVHAEAMITKPIRDLASEIVFRKSNSISGFEVTAKIMVGPAAVHGEFTKGFQLQDTVRFVHDTSLHDLRLLKYSVPDLKTFYVCCSDSGFRLDTLPKVSLKTFLERAHAQTEEQEQDGEKKRKSPEPDSRDSENQNDDDGICSSGSEI